MRDYFKDCGYLRDVSFNRSGFCMSSTPKYHAADLKTGLALCSSNIILNEDSYEQISRIPDSLRCKKAACKKAFETVSLPESSSKTNDQDGVKG